MQAQNASDNSLSRDRQSICDRQSPREQFIGREQQIDLRQYGNILARRKWFIAGVTALATATAAAFAFLLPPVYRANATVMIEAQQANVIQIQNVYDLDTRGQEYFQTQFEILKSRPLAEAVVRKLDLADKSDFQAPGSMLSKWQNAISSEPLELTPASWQKNLTHVPPSSGNIAKQNDSFMRSDASAQNGAEMTAVDRYLRRLEIHPIPKTQLVSVAFDASDPQLAAAIANAHAQAFIESYMDAKETMTRTAAEWMSSRLQDLRQKLAAAEHNLQAFKEREQLIDIDGVQTLPAQELTELTTKLVEARRSLSESRNMYEQVSAARIADLNEKLAIPAVASDELVQKFKQAEAEAEARVAELARRYGPQHPKMKAAISERDAARDQLQRQIDNVMDAAKNQYDVLRNQEQALATAMRDTKTHVNIAGRKEADYRELQREVETNRQLYELFYKRISETAETDNLATANARVIEPAVAPAMPFKPQRGLLIGMGFAVGLMSAVMLAFLFEAANNTVRHGNDVIEKLRVPMLAVIPMLRPRRKKASLGLQFLERGEPAFGEAIRTLRTSVNLSGSDKSPRAIMVTSSTSGEGKTAAACNLALAFAQLERVLLIDTDLRRPALAREFALRRDQPGLSALCAGRATVEQCIARAQSGGTNLDILAAGEIPPNPQELLASPQFRALIKTLSHRYDRVIFDCSPVLPVSDALLLANIASAAVYVVRAESTPVSQIRRGVELLRRTRVDVLGVVLNQVDPRKIASYGEYGGVYLVGDYLATCAREFS